MAITFVNAGTEGAAGSGTTVTPGSPASPASGDVWLCTGSFATALTPAMHADWTLIGSFGGSAVNKTWMWRFRYAGTPPTNNTITTASSTTNRTAGIAAFRGCKASGTPHQADAAWGWGAKQLGAIGGGLTPDGLTLAAGLIPAQLNSMVVYGVAHADDIAYQFIPYGYAAAFEDVGAGTQNAFVDTTGTPDSSIACFYKNVLLPHVEQRYEIWGVDLQDITWSCYGIVLIPEPTHKIVGVTRDNAGAALGSVTVYLLKLDSGKFYHIDSQVSNASTGAYDFRIAESAGSYAIAAKKAGSPNVFDITDFNLTPVVI